VKKGYVLETSGGVYLCDKLVMASGLSVPIYPTVIDNSVKKPKHYGEYPAEFFKKEESLETFRNKSLLIVGNGNAAYELGNLLTPYCSSLVIHGRRPKEWALSTHYTGDLRSVYLPFFDTFLLKSLNAIDHQNTKLVIDQETETSKYLISHYCSEECSIKHPSFRDSIDGFDHIIYCTGWKFNSSVFDFALNTTTNGKYPHINEKYESSNNPGLFFIGSLMHSHDFKRGSGGFIHGFRYLIRYFFQLHYTKKYDVKVLKDETALVDHIIKRINTSSSLYQMYGHMCDIISYNKKTGGFIIHENMTVFSFPGHLFLDETLTYFVLTFEYGPKVMNISQFGDKVSRLGKESNSTLLHPVLKVYDGKRTFLDEIHFDEDILAKFTAKDKYVDKFLRTFKAFSI
jgi:thioredoxin reductase